MLHLSGCVGRLLTWVQNAPVPCARATQLDVPDTPARYAGRSSHTCPVVLRLCDAGCPGAVCVVHVVCVSRQLYANHMVLVPLCCLCSWC